MSSLSNINSFTRSMNGLNNINANSIDTSNLVVDTLTINTSGTTPTLVSTDNSNKIASTAFVQSAISGAGTNYVTLNTNQTITSTKTYTLNQNIPIITGKYIDLFAGQLRMFSGSTGGSAIYIYVPPSGRAILDFSSTNCDMVGQFNLTSNNITCSVAPISANEYTNKNYCDNTFVDKINNQTISGIKIFNDLPESSITPSNNNQLVNKLYVDNAVTGGLTNYVTTNTTQTITGQKTFSATNTLITGNLVNDIHNSSSATATLSIGNNQTSGILNIGTSGTRNLSSTVNLGGSIANTNINGAILNLTAGNNININSSGTSANYNIMTTGGTSGSLNIGTNQVSGTANICTNSTRTGDINIGNISNTANININSNSIFNKIPNCSVVPSSANNLCNKNYVDSIGTNLLSSNNIWTGQNVFNGKFEVNQVLAGNIDMTVASHTDNYYFNFVSSPSTIGSLRFHFVNAINKFRISQEIAGKSLAIGLSTTDYIICNPTTTYCDIPKLSTGFVDYTLNTINARSGYSLSLGLNGTNMITLDNTTSKILMAPTRCSSYLEVVGEIQANNPIELNYNPSSLSAGRLGYQYYSTSTTTPTTNASRNIIFSGTGLDYFTLPEGVWLCELYSGWAQTSNNRAISLSVTSATTDNSRAQYSTQQNSSYQELTLTTALSVTNSTTRYYFVISNGGNSGSYSSVQHYLRITRIA